MVIHEENPKCIRSLRIARELIREGFLPLGVEAGRKSKGFMVFLFANTPELNAILSEIMRRN